MVMPILLSVKPRFAAKLLDGTKAVELRRSFPTLDGTEAFIYASTPVRAVIGVLQIVEVQVSPVEEIWDAHNQHMALQRHEFDSYLAGRTRACALLVQSHRRFEQPVSLAELRHAGLTPPQSFRYIRPGDLLHGKQ